MPTHCEIESTTAADRIAEFLTSMFQANLSPKTVADYRGDLDLFRRWFQGIFERPLRWELLEAQELLEYRQHLMNVARLKPATINRRMQALRRFCRWAHAEGHLEGDPSEQLKTIRTAIRQTPPHLQQPEIQALLTAAREFGRGQTRRNYALIQFMLQTGVRPQEIKVMCIDDVAMHLPSAMVRVKRVSGGREREIPLNSIAQLALQDYLATRTDAARGAPLFESGRGTRMSVRTIQNAVAQLARQAKLTRIQVSPKTLRHTFAINYLRQNPGGMEELAVLLGNDSLDATAIYAEFSTTTWASDPQASPLDSQPSHPKSPPAAPVTANSTVILSELQLSIGDRASSRVPGGDGGTERETERRRKSRDSG